MLNRRTITKKTGDMYIRFIFFMNCIHSYELSEKKDYLTEKINLIHFRSSISIQRSAISSLMTLRTANISEQ